MAIISIELYVLRILKSCGFGTDKLVITFSNLVRSNLDFGFPVLDIYDILFLIYFLAAYYSITAIVLFMK